MTKSLKLKICGMRAAENIISVANLKPDFIGFIFYDKSKRNAENILDKNTFDDLDLEISKVGVFVDADIDYILKINENFAFDYLQLHGEETAKECQSLKNKYGFHIIKAFSVDNSFDFNILNEYIPFVDYFLFDTKATLPGGNGIKFDWSVLKNYNFQKPFFLSGGIEDSDLEQVKELQKTIPQLFAIDVNSKFEIEPGLKDVTKLKILASGL